MAGAEEQGRIYSIDASGNTAFYTLGIAPEDFELIPPGENFFGVGYADRVLYGAPASEFAGMEGDILIAQESGFLWHVRWNGTAFDARAIAQVNLWEHVTFAPTGIKEIQPPVSITLTSLVNPSTLGEPVTFTAMVANNYGSNSLTGTVLLKEGQTTLGTIALDATGKAVFTIPYLSIGTHDITASFVSSSGSVVGTSPVLTQAINKAATATKIIGIPNPSLVGQATILRAMISAAASDIISPTGTVVFKDGDKILGTSLINASGQVTFATSTLSLGNHRITGFYSGDGNYLASSSTPLLLAVNSSNQSPIASCKSVTVSAGTACVANASINNNSYDPDGDPLTITQSPAGPYRLGTSAVTLTVADNKGASSSCTATVTVVDRSLPTVSSAVTTPSLWPPNHDLINVGLSYNAQDNCSSGGAIKYQVKVYANEDDEAATGDGNFSPDAKAFNAGALRLRAERKGEGNGRVYLIVITATDIAGNIGISCTTVVVPISQSTRAINAINATAAAAKAYCLARGGSPPSGYFVVGDGPTIGSKQ